MNKKNNLKLHIGFLVLTLLVLIWSGTMPKDRVTWVLEVTPVFIALAIIFFTYKKFQLTNLLYFLIMLHCMVLSVGGKYTYAEVPFGFWVQEFLHLTRNPWDRLGHLFQGFVPALVAREVLTRHKVVNGKIWTAVFCISVCLAFSAFYELIEWWVALLSGEGATAFLGTQGDVWDTQWDMFCCLIGSCAALLTLSHWHDRQLLQVKK